MKYDILKPLMFLALVGSGCSTSNSDGSASGTVRGQPFDTKSVVFDGSLIAFSDISDFCALSTAASFPDNIMWLSVLTCPTLLGEQRLGEYSVVSKVDTACNSKILAGELRIFTDGVPSSVPIDGGKLTISSADEGTLTGSVHLTFGSDSLDGTFSAANCPTLNK